MRIEKVFTLVAVCLFAASAAVWAHCEIPCGIYDDDMRFAMIDEHIATIEKSMTQIVALASAEQNPLNANQLARWVANKEHHADQIQEIVSQYFLTQKLKTPDESDTQAFAAYTGQLVLLHKMLRAAMVCKQTADLDNVEKLRQLAHDFKHAYQAAAKK